MEELRGSSRNKRELLNARSGADITANKSSERLGEENRGSGEYPLLNQVRDLHRHMYHKPWNGKTSFSLDDNESYL